MEEKLNEIIPYESIIRVLLKKVKIQEGIIADLEDELTYYENPSRFLTVLEAMNDEEKSALKSNPYYKVLRADVAKMEKEISKLRKSEGELINKLAVANKVIKDYFMV